MENKIINKENKELALADIVQTTILVDRSSSMRWIWSATITALSELEKELGDNLLSIRAFNSKDKMIKNFDLPTKDLTDISPEGMTNIYGSLLEAINHSKETAQITPELNVHHVFVVITDGYSNTHSHDEYMKCQKAIADIDVEATFFLLDSTEEGNAGADLGFQSVGFQNTPESIKNAIEKVRDAINVIGDNVYNQLNPRANLCLPPAK